MLASGSGLLVLMRWGVSAVDEATSKNMDGITDLVVVAPIKEGFIAAFETTSFSGRLQLVAEALNRLRVTAREHERLVPFSDVTERILSLLDFRIGIIDKDLYGLVAPSGAPDQRELEPRRYLYLTATFEGGFEPYMRQIWRPLGPFLDLLFCNCEGYVTATEHSFDEYIQWVRDNQVESAIFYATTGLTVRDHKYLSKLEAVQRGWDKALVDPNARELALATTTMPYPDEEADKTRSDPRNWGKTLELGFEAMNVLFKLADYYPPEWLTGMTEIGNEKKMGEGHRLLRATREILSGWDQFLIDVKAEIAKDPDTDFHKEVAKRLAGAEHVYREPLNWYRTGTAHLKSIDAPPPPMPPEGPTIDVTDIQAGILKPHGSITNQVRHGALLMFTVRDAEAARLWIGSLLADHKISFEGGDPTAKLFANIAFTSTGLRHLAMHSDKLDRFPKEFREGMAQRSGILGDMREHHPRNWQLPVRNGPAFLDEAFEPVTLPPVELEEVDFVLQLRSTHDDGGAALEQFAKQLALEAAGATLEAIEWLNVQQNGDERFVDHFGYIDGISQPKPAYKGGTEPTKRDRVALGEVLRGYANDRQDGPPAEFDTLDGDGSKTHWRKYWHREALAFQNNGSYLVVRKIGMETDAFNRWLDEQQGDVAAQLNISAAEARALLMAKVMGRDKIGDPLVAPPPAGMPARAQNDFDFAGDLSGKICPHAAHIRRANPRKADMSLNSPVETRAEFNRPSPRLLRRGMLFGEPGKGGLMFMAYAASIAEQYEVIQRWLNGGNSTDVASANNDILTGVQPREGVNTFRFVAQRIGPDGTSSDVVVRVPLPPVKLRPDGQPNPGDQGKHPFTPLYWGLYLFAPSRKALQDMVTWKGIYIPIAEMLEEAVGKSTIGDAEALPEAASGKMWKRIIEDFVTRDPTERNISPSVWSAIRYNYGGAYRINGSMPVIKGAAVETSSNSGHNWCQPNEDHQNVIICAGEDQVMQVLAQWQHFSSEEQVRRIKDNAGPLYVVQQPDNDYVCTTTTDPADKWDYHAESHATNAALYNYSKDQAFKDGYEAGVAVMMDIKARGTPGPEAIGNFVKIELKREYFQPAIAELWARWYGLPAEDEPLRPGAWSWKKIVSTLTDAEIDQFGETDVARKYARCPGDFMAPSRGSVYPRPSKMVRQFADMHGKAILEAGHQFVEKYRPQEDKLKTDLIKQLFDACPNDEQGNKVLARNIIGTMMGSIPPTDANLRNIMLDWLLEKTLWRHQAAMHRALAGKPMLQRMAEVQEALHVPMSQAMCKRPSPDILFRTAKKGAPSIQLREKPKELFKLEDVNVQEGDLLTLSLVSATQRSLARGENDGAGDLSAMFGGKRKAAWQGYLVTEGGGVTPDPTADNDHPVHACPAQKMAMGGMAGILAALLEAGTIQALPASLIVRISGFALPPKPSPTPPASG